MCLYLHPCILRFLQRQAIRRPGFHGPQFYFRHMKRTVYHSRSFTHIVEVFNAAFAPIIQSHCGYCQIIPAYLSAEGFSKRALKQQVGITVIRGGGLVDQYKLITIIAAYKTCGGIYG
jgi:hypothetical protein